MDPKELKIGDVVHFLSTEGPFLVMDILHSPETETVAVVVRTLTNLERERTYNMDRRDKQLKKLSGEEIVKLFQENRNLSVLADSFSTLLGLDVYQRIREQYE